jgi:hypothetical protein
MVRILGIDPGINGACALYCSDSTVPTIPNGMFDIPTVGDGPQREIDYGYLRDLIYATQPDLAVIEIVNAFMPKREVEGGVTETVQWGGTSLFRFGGSYYAIHAVVACLNIPRHRVSSAKWKNHFGLKGKAKGGGIDDSARQVVLRRFPALQPFLMRKGDQHRAEAFLMAVWYADTGGGAKVARARKLAKPAGNMNNFFDVDTADAEDIPE